MVAAASLSVEFGLLKFQCKFEKASRVTVARERARKYRGGGACGLLCACCVLEMQGGLEVREQGRGMDREAEPGHALTEDLWEVRWVAPDHHRRLDCLPS